MIKKESLPTLAELGMEGDKNFSFSYNDIYWYKPRLLHKFPAPIKNGIELVKNVVETKNHVRILFLARDGLIWASTIHERDSHRWGAGVHRYGHPLGIMESSFNAIKAHTKIFIDTLLRIDTQKSSHELIMQAILKGMKI